MFDFESRQTRTLASGLVYLGLSDVDLLIENEDEARTYVRRSKDWGADFIKVYPSLSWPLQRAVAEEARRMALPVAGHGTSAEEVIRSVKLGYAWLEHPTDAFDDILQMLALAGTRWVPTLGAAAGVVRLVQDEPDRPEDPKFRAFVPEWCFSPPLATELSAEYRRLEWAKQQATTLVAHRRGVRLYAGTDFGCFYGASLHWELEFLVEAGLSPLEVLRIATRWPARPWKVLASTASWHQAPSRVGRWSRKEGQGSEVSCPQGARGVMA